MTIRGRGQAGATVAHRRGWDIHALVTGRWLVLGGVEIAHSHGLAGHLRRRCAVPLAWRPDALFGAAALGDIGHHFPDTDAQFKDADSLALLAEAGAPRARRRFEIANLDSTIVAQAPGCARNIRRCASGSPRRWRWRSTRST